MTTDGPPGRFEPRPRRRPTQRTETDAENLHRELERILGRTEIVAASDRHAFTEGSVAHDVASIAFIRLSALLERPEFEASAMSLTGDEIAAIRTTRNIAVHAGYGGMNDDLFWVAVTTRVPAIIRRLLDSTSR